MNDTEMCKPIASVGWLPEPYRPLVEYDAPGMKNGVLVLGKGIDSRKMLTDDIFSALMCAAGARVGGMSDVDDENYPPATTRNWEWFDPFRVTDPFDLPEHWQFVFMNQNDECWSEGYRYVHAPVALRVGYPHLSVSGVLVVTRTSATPSNVTADDLVHVGDSSGNNRLNKNTVLAIGAHADAEESATD